MPIEALLETMARLRAPDGCPWDREQDHMTLRRYAVEEVYELLDAIEAGNDPDMIEELGDVLLQVVFHCQMARDRGAFGFEDVCRGITEKLVRRHPHVFGRVRADTADEVLSQWEVIKQAEKAKKGETAPPASVLSQIPRHLPALLQAERFLKKTRDLQPPADPRSPAELTADLVTLVEAITAQGFSAEELLRTELLRLDAERT
jgi:MazG family protein